MEMKWKSLRNLFSNWRLLFSRCRQITPGKKLSFALKSMNWKTKQHCSRRSFRKVRQIHFWLSHLHFRNQWLNYPCVKKFRPSFVLFPISFMHILPSRKRFKYLISDIRHIYQVLTKNESCCERWRSICNSKNKWLKSLDIECFKETVTCCYCFVFNLFMQYTIFFKY